MALYLMFNGIERFLIEKIRVNATFDFIGMEITQAEIISVLFFLAGVAAAVVFYKRHQKMKTDRQAPAE